MPSPPDGWPAVLSQNTVNPIISNFRVSGRAPDKKDVKTPQSSFVVVVPRLCDNWSIEFDLLAVEAVLRFYVYVHFIILSEYTYNIYAYTWIIYLTKIDYVLSTN